MARKYEVSVVLDGDEEWPFRDYDTMSEVMARIVMNPETWRAWEPDVMRLYHVDMESGETSCIGQYESMDEVLASVTIGC